MVISVTLIIFLSLSLFFFLLFHQVKASGILDSMKSEERKRQEVCFTALINAICRSVRKTGRVQ